MWQLVGICIVCLVMGGFFFGIWYNVYFSQGDECIQDVFVVVVGDYQFDQVWVMSCRVCGDFGVWSVVCGVVDFQNISYGDVFLVWY